MIKYILSIILLIMGSLTVKDPRYVLVAFMELLLIAFITNSLKQVNKHFQILNNILMLFYNTQNLILLFGSHYLLLVMLENTDSIHMLEGRMPTYIAGVVVVVIASFLPVKVIEYKKKWMHALTLIPLAAEAILVLTIGGRYSPYTGYMGLISDMNNKAQMKKEMISAAALDDSAYDIFLKNDQDEADEVINEVINEELNEDISTQVVEEAYEEPKNTNGFDSDKNIILIFTEGLSLNVIEDERNIMPNMAALKNETISFTNYYNHTFATYRGIQGQLYSGYQYDNYDTNNLTSMMDVLRDNGYFTAFINVEPNNKEFYTYQSNMGFDEVYSTTGYYTGEYDTDILNIFYSMYPDINAYDMLYNYANQLREENKKFFLVIYTAGTHASFDSYDQKFGDGSDAELNKFYDCDYSFGIFLDRFKNSELVNDTAVILTADHATYADELFVKAFPNYERIIGSCDRVPFYIYFKGQTGIIDAGGRNSLDFAPTILDMIGLKSPNTFLGTSLLKEAPAKDSLEYYMWDPDMLAYSGNEVLEYTLGDEASRVRSDIAKYFGISTK